MSPRLFASLALAFTVVASAPGGSAPDWVRALASQPVPAHADSDHAIILLDSGEIDVAPDGRLTRHARYAVRILDRDGADSTAAFVHYESDSDKVRAFHCWLVPATGKSYEFPKSRVADIAAYSSALELYGASRIRALDASDEATPGSVFAYESVTEERTIFTQLGWDFQPHRLPVADSRLTINLPPGWSATGHIFNHPDFAPVVRGDSYTWELRSIPSIADEPHALDTGAQLAVDLDPRGARSHTSDLAFFDRWGSIVDFFLPKYDAASQPGSAIQARAAAIAPATADTWSQVAALCRYAQSVNYISINLNAGGGGGMIPRPAERVEACRYGDCKDKATLLRGLLRARGITAYPVILYAEDRFYVNADWPSAFQFNHCILAIRADDSFPAGTALIDHPRLGRLLIFDPTDAYTPPGLLPESDLGGQCLVLAPGEDTLTRLPSSTPAENHIERHITARLTTTGAVSGTIDEQLLGLASAAGRAAFKTQSKSDYSQMLNHWIAQTMPGASTPRVEATDDLDHARFRFTVDFSAPAYAKSMRDVLLVVKPVLVSRRDDLVFRSAKRTRPVVLDAWSFSEQTTLEIPPGFHVDENFTPVDLTTPFGHYTARAEAAAGRIDFKRTLEISDAVIPPESYDSVRTFFEKILAAEQTPIVLAHD